MIGLQSNQAKIESVKPLTMPDLMSTSPVPAKSNIDTIRDTHHMIARLVAMGLKQVQVAARSGFTTVRVNQLCHDPAFMELVEHYRGLVTQGFKEEVDEFFEYTNRNRNMAARLISDKLADGGPEDFSIKELQAIVSDAADRTGYPKRREAINLNLDFAARLDRAVKRSEQARVIEGTAIDVSPAHSVDITRRI